jgi:hypothetical protein
MTLLTLLKFARPPPQRSWLGESMAWQELQQHKEGRV